MSEKKLLLIGSGPLICEAGITNQTAFGLRTWQFLSAIKKIEGSVKIILLDESRFYENFPATNTARTVEIFGKKVEVVHLEKNSKNFFQNLKSHATNFAPKILVGINLMPSFYAAKLALSSKIPFWADLNGWSLAEAQSQAFIEKNNAYIPTIWEREKFVLNRADKISTVSNPQNFATMGQLSTLGRIRFETENFNFVSTIENANETAGLEKFSANRKPYDVRKKVPAGSKIIFFSGAYNTWLDEENLFSGLEKAMKQNEKIYFVSTGSGVKGFSNKVFASFKTRIENSEFSDRFIFLGWLDRADLIDCYAQVDVAINLDRNNTETVFGARNRINEWLVYGVPIMSTVGSQITQDLAESDLITAIEMENSDDLADKILSLNLSEIRTKAEDARAFAKEFYSYKNTMAPLAKFLENPEISPDKYLRMSMNDSLVKRGIFKIKQIGVGGVVELIKKNFF